MQCFLTGIDEYVPVPQPDKVCESKGYNNRGLAVLNAETEVRFNKKCPVEKLDIFFGCRHTDYVTKGG